MSTEVTTPNIDLDTLRCEISKEYAEVATNPAKGFHFHTGRPLAKILGYSDSVFEGNRSQGTQHLNFFIPDCVGVEGGRRFHRN